MVGDTLCAMQPLALKTPYPSLSVPAASVQRFAQNQVAVDIRSPRRSSVVGTLAGGFLSARLFRRRWRRLRSKKRVVMLSGSRVSARATASAANPSHWRDWADDLGIESASVDLTTFTDSFGGTLRGMSATKSVEADEPLLTVPADRVLQVTTGGECPVEGVIDRDAWRSLEWWGQLAFLLLVEKKQGPESPLAAWVDSLPSVLDLAGVPLNWSDEELSALNYPSLVQKVKQQRQEVTQAYERAASGCSSITFSEEEFSWAMQVVRSRTFSGAYEGRSAEERVTQVALAGVLLAVGVLSGQVSLENGLNGGFLAVFSIPLTDFFVGNTAGLKRHVLCPVVDYLNHDSEAVSDIAYEYFGDAFSVRISNGFANGEEVRINYGEKKSNDELMQYYGFVEPGCAYDVYELDVLEHLDDEAKASGTSLQVKLTCTGPDEKSIGKLRELLADEDERQLVADEGINLRKRPISETNEAVVWQAVALACEGELERRKTERERSQAESSSAVARFSAEKERVLRNCYAHVQSRLGRPTSDAPLSLTTRQLVYPTFEETVAWRHAWADSVLSADAVQQFRTSGYCILHGAFDVELAGRCLRECTELDAKAMATVTTNPCNKGSRSTWLEFASEEQRATLVDGAGVPALTQLSQMLAGLPGRADDLGAFDGPPLRVHPATMIAVYPERAAEYVAHKDSYAPDDNNPATGGTRRMTILAYLNERQEDGGGELRLHESQGGKPDKRKFTTVAPTAGSIVIFDSPRVWHAVAPSLKGARWAMTLWVH